MRPIITASIVAAAIVTGALVYAQTATQPGVVLTWDHPAPQTVTRYWIERSLRTDFRNADTLGPVLATTYTDRPTTAGRIYYRVFAEGPGGTSAPSDYAQIVIVPPPVAPVNVSAKNEGA